MDEVTMAEVHEGSFPSNEHTMTPGRLNTIVDGIFAIAMTLLVLDLPRPSLSGQLVHDLEIHWDAYIAYIVSFATLGVVWLEHHGMMLAVRRTSRRFIEITLVFLLFVTLLPWPTALAAQFAPTSLGSEIADKAKTARLVTVLYSSNMLVISLALAWSWWYLSRNPRLLKGGWLETFRASFPRIAKVCVPYLVAIAVAFFSPLGSLLIDGAVVAYLAVSASALERAEADPPDEPDELP
jgi:uncharacterized membrane protein